MCMKKSSNRGRMRHVQQQLFRRGGKRRRAGRKPNGTRAGSRHETRPAFKSNHALHVVLRVVPAVGNMRRRALYKAMREATITAALRERFRIVHLSIQRNHVHMLAEAKDKLALARGMQGFQISAARNINTALAVGYRRRRGSVFADRYHLEVITSPTRARHVLNYTLNNWRKRATRPCWSIRKEDCGPTEIWRSHPAGESPARLKLARQAGSEPCDEHDGERDRSGTATGSAMRRRARVRAVGSQPRNQLISSKGPGFVFA